MYELEIAYQVFIKLAIVLAPSIIGGLLVLIWYLIFFKE
nr:MAG TPA: hypothetical protein [Caudoviricetes sp.]